MSTPILILTASYGEGHNAAARALAQAINTQGGERTARVVDAFELAGPRRNALSRRVYLGLINRAPGIWRAAYTWLDRSPRAPALLRLLARERGALARILAQEQPALLCSTYPVYGYLLDQLHRSGQAPIPHYNVVTDSISINSLWWRARCDGWFLPNEDSATVLRQAGIPGRLLHVHGFPVDRQFGSTHPAAAAITDLSSGVRPRVLYIVNSRTAAAVELARQLVQRPEWDVTCTVGRNEPLRVELAALAQQRPPGAGVARVLGWTDEIPALLQTHHVVVSKAGGATTQEALAARCPMIVNQIVPGQEEGNYELLRRHRIGTLAETPRAVLAALELAFRDGGAVWQAWRRALQPLSRPQAAPDIARIVLARLGRLQEPIPLPMRGNPEVPMLPSTASVPLSASG